MNKKITKWSLEDIETLYRLPFNDLIYKAQTVHRENHDPNKIQVSTLMSIKTGGCPEDCKYCSQSIKYNTDVEIGSYPFFHAGKLGVSIVLRSEDQKKIDNCNTQILEFIREKKIEVVDR